MPTCLAIGTTTIRPPGQSLPEEQHRSTVFCEHIVRPACEQLGLTFLRADRLTEAGLPMDQLLRTLTEVDVVVADLVGASDPELSFGLGVRHALGRCTVHVTEDTDRFPASGTTPRIPFPSHPDDAVSVCRQLMSVLATEVLRADSPRALPAGPPPQPVPETATEGDAEGPGLFDLVVEAETQLEALSGDMADVEAAMSDLGEMLELIGEDMARVSHPGAPMRMKLAVLNRMAKAIEGPTDDLEAAAGRFAERMRVSLGAFRVFLEWAAATPRSEWPEDTEGMLEQVAATSLEVQSAASSYQEVVAVIDMVGTSSRQLRRPARRIIASFQTIFESASLLGELQGMAAALKQS
ncbi:hypothetical protein ACIQMP_01285 [Streptomyces sp. NPDC091385]|uniref:hypothetical protein n=1 Tax=Streptomyces sp. NPDC091385 TaxID=3365997 RepID=UPI0038106202